MDNARLDTIARQQPAWPDPAHTARVRRDLAARPALVSAEDVGVLRTLLTRVAAGEAHVIQAGDCAEDPAECTAGYIARKSALLDLLAGTMKLNTHKPVLRVGRFAGQFAKPRSSPTEVVGGVEMPVYRGHMVNSPEPDVECRRPDPTRLVTGYLAAREAMANLGWPAHGGGPAIEPPVWTSHEALLLDYELPMVRRDGTGRSLLSSTHWPWVGERTRGLDSAHVELLAGVLNPVGCKVGPATAAADLLAVCDRLDPDREPGRLTLIARMGADAVGDRLPGLVRAVRAAGHPAIWLCDPMHGNTVQTPSGLKTRYLETIVREVRGAQEAIAEAGGVAGGLHLETTPDEVTECAGDRSGADRVGEKYTSFCDPRLNPGQAVAVVSAWTG
ncbi:3-deoxy-7-phosphoheptulonate synthase [Actinokineospora sp. NBRC 105648]|uniref:3-deoxy-7-phosphoheptulonate synthase n=1 Tax=Actinokineospora sp. NBRC 105648 TaxID=3032206 RepID=UPI002554F295|nr:3-deoxy-7-phosphoheptulonate synthase [Actinokineospora sp. NBRC 105648]